jgi:hypothetical protein
VTCFQSSGRIGKSTMFEGILAWARFAEIPVGAVDCAAEHLTLSKRFIPISSTRISWRF